MCEFKIQGAVEIVSHVWQLCWKGVAQKFGYRNWRAWQELDTKHDGNLIHVTDHWWGGRVAAELAAAAENLA